MENERPHSTEAEREVLTAILFDADALEAVNLRVSDFYSPAHRAIFSAMLRLQAAGKALTVVTMKEEIPDGAVTAEYLATLCDDAWTAVGLDEHLSIVKDKAVKRESIPLIEQLLAHAFNGKDPVELEAETAHISEMFTKGKPEPEGHGFELLSDLFQEPDVATEWLLDRLLPMGGTCILGAKPGSGKSTILRNLVMSVADGLPFLGRSVKQGPCLMLSLEESKGMVKKTMRTMGATGANIHLRCLDLTDGMGTLRAAIADIKPVLVTIDTLADFVQVDSMNDYAPLKKVMHQLSQLAHDTGVHILLSHHDRKGEHGADSLLGSVAIGGSVDSVLLLDFDFTSRQRTLSTLKQRYPDGDVLEPVVLGIDGRHCLSLLGSKAEAVYYNLGNKMLDILSDGPMTQSAVLKAVKGKNDAKSSAIQRLETVGKITRKMEGKRYICSLIEKEAGKSKPSELFPSSSPAKSLESFSSSPLPSASPEAGNSKIAQLFPSSPPISRGEEVRASGGVGREPHEYNVQAGGAAFSFQPGLISDRGVNYFMQDARE